MRPANFEINPNHSLARGLVFAGLGACAGSNLYKDSSLYGRHANFATSLDPYTTWELDFGRRFIGLTGTYGERITGTKGIGPGKFGTVSLWAYLNSNPSSYGCLVSSDGTIGDGDANNNFILWVAAGGNLECAVGNGSGAAWNTAHTLAIQAWEHICYSWDGSNVRLWINGAELSPQGYGFTASQQPGNATIGWGAGGYEIDGKIMDFMVHNRALSLPEIQLLASPNPMLGGLIKPLGDYSPTPNIYNLEGVR